MQGQKSVSVLITAGGTREAIDAVRSIANHATGRLGAAIADAFLQGGARVDYVCGEGAVLPAFSGAAVTVIRDVAQLTETLDKLLRENSYDYVIHAMAVSDFTPHSIGTAHGMAERLGRELYGLQLSEEALTARILSVLLGGGEWKTGGKISSQTPYLMMTLKQTPKVIGRIKAARPGVVLVGFKLLSGVSEGELISAGTGLMEKNGCDYVLANDLQEISGESHQALLLGPGGVVGRAGTKTEIAQMIFKTLTEKADGKGGKMK